MRDRIENQTLTGERALFRGHELEIDGCRFCDGESPMKEASDLQVRNSVFAWKYPFWYALDIYVEDSTWEEMGRAGVWYTKNMEVNSSVIDAPKNFRRCENLTLSDVTFHRAEETLWYNSKVKLLNVKAKGDYFAMGCSDVYVEGLELDGNYGFDGVKNLEVHSSRLMTKDAFWNCDNVTIYDSYIEGEYFGWNSRNVRLVNCTVSSLQGFCYIENLTLENCDLSGTNLAFEFSTNIDATITDVRSILNPSSGRITADHIGRLTIQPDKVDLSKVEIACDSIDLEAAEPDFEENV